MSSVGRNGHLAPLPLAALIGLVLGTPILLSASVFHHVIPRAAPLGTSPSDSKDPVAVTMSAARAWGWDWLTATRHQRWTQRGVDGVETVGYWFPASRSSSCSVVLLHGHRADASLMGRFGAWYRDLGFNVFIADARGHGMSGGDYVGMGVLDQSDYLSWLDRIVATVGDDAPIVLHGLSMGAATALMLGAHPLIPRQIRAIIADCSFSSVTDEMHHHLSRRLRLARAFGVVGIASALTKMTAGYWFADANPLRVVGKVTAPVLLIHGDADDYNPFWMATRLYDSLRSPKRLWVVPGAGHGESFFTHREQYERQVQRFLHDHLAGD